MGACEVQSPLIGSYMRTYTLLSALWLAAKLCCSDVFFVSKHEPKFYSVVILSLYRLDPELE